MAALDTDILVGLLKGAPDAVDKMRTLQDNGDSISTTMITAYELIKGAHLSSKADENVAKVSETISSMSIHELSLGAAEEAGRIYRELQDKGKLIGEFDILIAGIVKFNDETLVTRDERFSNIRGIKLARW